MKFDHLANELVLHIFHSCTSIMDVLHLAATCQHLRKVFGASQKLLILYAAAEAQFGPIEDAIQVVTRNSSQPAHVIRKAPFSLALLRQVIEVGRTAHKWEEIYPAKKWKHNFEDRRLLTSSERYSLRRAIYRLWLYSRAFHNPRYPRTTRMHRQNVIERAELLHNWTTPELAEIEDVREINRNVLQNHICPSNGTIQRKFRKHFPDSDQQHLFNIHLNYPPPPTAFQAHFHSTHQISASPIFCPQHNSNNNNSTNNTLKFQSTAFHEPGTEGWGDDIPHYYVVEDMLKLDPGQIMWLKENAPFKGMVESYVKGLGEWFENNGETFGQTLGWVMQERGEDVDELRENVWEGSQGILASGR